MSHRPATVNRTALASYWAGSASASVMADYASGNVRTLVAGAGSAVNAAPKRDRAAEAGAASDAVFHQVLADMGLSMAELGL